MSTYSFPFGPTFKPGAMGAETPTVFFDDFVTGGTSTGNKFSTSANGGEWLVTDGGTALESPTVRDAADGGWVSFEADNVDGVQLNLQLNGEAFTFAPGRRVYFECRFLLELATTNYFIGLSTTTTDPIGTRPTQYIAFTSAAATATANIEWSMDDNLTADIDNDTGVDVTAGTFVTVAFDYTGTDKVNFYVDEAFVGSIDTNVPKASPALSPVMCVESIGTGSNERMTVDYLMVVMDRAPL